ncbi:unnamed protein product, partial [marine sediment metagenome]
MAEAYLELKANDICDLIEAYTGDATVGAALKHLKAGVQRFLTGLDPRDNEAHLWSFLQPISTVTIWATSTTTLDGPNTTKDNGTSTVTVDDATFYDSMIGYDLTIGTTAYPITAVASTTVCTVTG